MNVVMDILGVFVDSDFIRRFGLYLFMKTVTTKTKKPVKEKAKKKVEEKAGPKKKVEEKPAVVSAKVAAKKKPAAIKEKTVKPAQYLESVGKRKTAVARVRIFTKGKMEILVNEKSYQDYFFTSELQQIATDSLRKMKCLDKFKVSVKVRGGGISAQAEAVRHGISRALVMFNPDFRKRLRRAGYLTRDPRMRERKKFGLKRARRAPQWQKR